MPLNEREVQDHREEGEGNVDRIWVLPRNTVPCRMHSAETSTSIIFITDETVMLSLIIIMKLTFTINFLINRTSWIFLYFEN